MDETPSTKPPRKLRVAFTDSNIFQQIPEEGPLARSASLPRGNLWSSIKAGSVDNVSSWNSPTSWKSSLGSTIKESLQPLQSSWSLGFLFPDDDDHDELREHLLSEDDHDDEDFPGCLGRGMSSDQESLLNDVETDCPNYGTWGSLTRASSAEVHSARGSLECPARVARVALATAKSCPSDLNSLNKKKLMHRCQTAPAMSSMNKERKAAAKLVRPQFEKGSSIVMQAGVGLLIYLAIGVAIYSWKNDQFSGLETLSVVDALYFCVVTMCTIGYGDITPTTPFAKLFSCLFVLIGFGFIDALVSGMVTYVLDKQEHLLLSAVEGSHFRTAKKYFLNAKHGNRMRIRMKVGLALGVPVLCIFVGTMVMMQFEQLSLIDSFYCTIMSVTTVGYGDHTFKSLWGRLFAALWLLFSTLAVARCFLYLAEARVDKRHRLIAKWVIQRELTVGDLVQADLDHDGCISKAEYVLYKLKEMGDLNSNEILDLGKQFDALDHNNSGKITLARLQEGN